MFSNKSEQSDFNNDLQNFNLISAPDVFFFSQNHTV